MLFYSPPTPASSDKVLTNRFSAKFWHARLSASATVLSAVGQQTDYDKPSAITFQALLYPQFAWQRSLLQPDFAAVQL
jgi:hypothetical protein